MPGVGEARRHVLARRLAGSFISCLPKVHYVGGAFTRLGTVNVVEIASCHTEGIVNGEFSTVVLAKSRIVDRFAIDFEPGPNISQLLFLVGRNNTLNMS